jgi:hypothetical protein
MPSSSAVNGGIGCDNSGTGCGFDSGTAMNVEPQYFNTRELGSEI